jgi:hypothetical protein
MVPVRASHAVQVKLEAAIPSMSNTIQDAVAEAATMILDKIGAPSRDYTAARSYINSLYADGRLGEDDVAGFAAANQFEETATALAVLCNLPVEAVDRAMAQDRPETVLVMTKAIGMSWPTVKAILRMCAGPPRISPGELEQYLSTFSRLKPLTARQVMEFRSNPSQGARFGRYTGYAGFSLRHN